MAAEVEGDEGIQAADAGAADEDEGRRGGGAGEVGGAVVGVVVGNGEEGDLEVVELDDGGVDADGGEELLHRVAHAAGVAAKDDHGVLRYQPLDSRLRRLLVVDRQGGACGPAQVQLHDVV